MDIQPPDLETRVAILNKKALAENITISDEVVFYIADKIESNIRVLEGSLTRVMAYAQLNSKPVTRALVDDALKDILADRVPRKIDAELIQQRVGELYGLKSEDFPQQEAQPLGLLRPAGGHVPVPRADRPVHHPHRRGLRRPGSHHRDVRLRENRRGHAIRPQYPRHGQRSAQAHQRNSSTI